MRFHAKEIPFVCHLGAPVIGFFNLGCGLRILLPLQPILNIRELKYFIFWLLCVSILL